MIGDIILLALVGGAFAVVMRPDPAISRVSRWAGSIWARAENKFWAGYVAERGKDPRPMYRLDDD